MSLPGSGLSSILPIFASEDPRDIQTRIAPLLLTLESTELSPPIESFPSNELSTSVPTPTVDNTRVTYAGPMDDCILRHGCGRGPCIPQRIYDRARTNPATEIELEEVIPFSVRGECGYPLRDALRKQYTGLDGRDDKVFVDFRSSVSIRLEWLPYEKWTKQIRTLTWKQPPDNISLAKVATEVAKRMDIFFKEMHGKAVDPLFSEYRVQPGDIDHLELVALKRVAKSSYMPHFRLTAPPQPHDTSLL